MRDLKVLLYELDPSILTPGSTLRAFRKGLSLTIEDISDITGIHRTNISAIENDRTQMSLKYSEIFSAALGIHPTTLLYPSGDFKLTKELKKVEKKARKLLKKNLINF